MGNQNEKSDEIQYVMLPYDFVPFPGSIREEKYAFHFPYAEDNVPKHNQKEEGMLSGVINYKITPYSDLAIEVRKKKDGACFISGSSIRGKIRTNLEILSASYPDFIDRSTLLYRNVSQKNYHQRLMNSNEGDIERSIQVGFLKKTDNMFYVTPAQQIGDKNFFSIKEHSLLNMGLNSSNTGFSTLYDWKKSSNILKELNKLQEEIEKETKKIKEKREELNELLSSSMQSKISKLFTKKYNFIHKFKLSVPQRKELKERKITHYDYFKSKIKDFKNNLMKDLNNLAPNKDKLWILFELNAKRWELKAEIYLIYRYRMRENDNFTPYQSKIYFQRTVNNGIKEMSFKNSPEDNRETGYLFNSTNASSKRSHYFVMEPVKDQSKEYHVPSIVINGYNRNLRKFRTTDKNNKPFYDIFENYDALMGTEGTEQGLIVFFQSSNNPTTNEVEIAEIGRTPYFKIAHKTQLTDILGEKEANKVDYANALFGFIADSEAESILAYKSRLRFSAVDIVGKPEQEEVSNLVLMTPSASASAMYLKQTGTKLATYEDKKIKLNGYKYYHILEQTKTCHHHKENHNIVSSRKVLKHEGIQMYGKIYFHNISKKELGLLLLSLDWREVQKLDWSKLLESEKSKEYMKNYKEKIEDAYELIGGAKPYGYGKVKIEIESLQIEKNLQLEKEENYFKSLILEPMEQVSEWHKYIEAFIQSMGKEKYFKEVHFRDYIESKVQISPTYDLENKGKKYKRIDWDTMDKENEGKGYHKSWRLWSRKNDE